MEHGLLQLTVTATAEGARKMGLDPRAFPIEIDRAAGYTSEGPGVFLDPRAELEGKAEQQEFFLHADNLKESYEAAGLYIALGYMDSDRGLRGIGYIVKLLSVEPSMADYLASSTFGRTYTNRASQLFQPYLMQDEAEAAIAEGHGPGNEGFSPDLTKALCEDARDENSGLPLDKGYRLYSGNAGTAKFDFEEAPTDDDFVEMDDFPEDDPVGPRGTGSSSGSLQEPDEIGIRRDCRRRGICRLCWWWWRSGCCCCRRSPSRPRRRHQAICSDSSD